MWPFLATLFGATGLGAAGGSAAAGAGGAGLAEGLGAAGAIPAAFSGLGGGAIPGAPSAGGQLWTDLNFAPSMTEPESDSWYKGLFASDDPNSEPKMPNLPPPVQAPSMMQIPQQQRRPREQMQFVIPESIRSLMGG